MNHKYYDVSDLNAQWDQVPLQGIGYADYSNLSARWDDVPLQGLGAGVLSTGPTGSLGATTANYPWKSYSDDTKALQKVTNAALKANGYCPIGEDGQLGAATCGAIKTMLEVSGQTDQSPPATCQSYTAPSKGPCVGASAPPTPAKDDLTKSLTSMSAGGGGATWIIVGGVVAVGAIGAALYFTRKGR